MKRCFWCGSLLGIFGRAEIDVGGVKRLAHRTLWVDCANEFYKFQSAEKEKEMQQLLARVSAARAVH